MLPLLVSFFAMTPLLTNARARRAPGLGLAWLCAAFALFCPPAARTGALEHSSTAAAVQAFEPCNDHAVAAAPGFGAARQRQQCNAGDDNFGFAQAKHDADFSRVTPLRTRRDLSTRARAVADRPTVATCPSQGPPA